MYILYMGRLVIASGNFFRKKSTGNPRFSKYPVTKHITWIHGNPRDSSIKYVGIWKCMEIHMFPSYPMWYHVDRTAKKFRDDDKAFYNHYFCKNTNI